MVRARRRKVIQEFEGLFKGAGWNVIKVVWGREGTTARRRHGRFVGDEDELER